MTAFSWLTDPRALVGLVTLTFLQIVLGVDNVVLIAILSGRLPHDQQPRARNLGLIVAMASRIILLIVLLWIAKLVDRPLFHVASIAISGRGLIYFAGGLFLIAKATSEIHNHMEGSEEFEGLRPPSALNVVLIQIFILDVIFSLDQVITAIGMIDIVPVQVLSVVLATSVMMLGVHGLSEFIDRHPSIRMLALSFLVLIGVNLVAETFGLDIPRGYTYFAMAWSVVVELLNVRRASLAKRRREARMAESGPDAGP